MSKQTLKRNGAIIGAVTLFSAATVAIAGDKPSYGDLDANADGSISKQEADASNKLSESFDQYDVNANGSLEQGEFARFEAEVDAEAPVESNAAEPSDGLIP